MLLSSLSWPHVAHWASPAAGDRAGKYAIYDSIVPPLPKCGSATLPYVAARGAAGALGAGPGALEAAGRRAYSPGARRVGPAGARGFSDPWGHARNDHDEPERRPL